MKKTFVLAVIAMLIHSLAIADKGKSKKADKDSFEIAQLKLLAYEDSVNTAMKYQTGTVLLPTGVATLNIPAGFKYLNAEQSNFVISKVWGNPKQVDILGMLFPEKSGPFTDSSYAYVISFNALGYVKDEDADKIDYDQMLKDLQNDELEENTQRVKEGYEPAHIVGWAQKPFYDKTRNVLHWAKEIQFGDKPGENTLNYDIRFLGRKGVLSFNAVSSMSQLNLVKEDISKVLVISNFTAGHKYSDFNPSVDQVAAYTVGGLVAGKILLKIGFWAMIVKFWKLIIGGLMAAWYGVKKYFVKRKGVEEVEEVTEPVV